MKPSGKIQTINSNDLIKHLSTVDAKSLFAELKTQRKEFFSAASMRVCHDAGQSPGEYPLHIPDKLWQIVEPLFPDLDTDYQGPGMPLSSKRLVTSAILTVVFLQTTAQIFKGNKTISPATVSKHLAIWKKKRVFRRIKDIALPDLDSSTGTDWRWINNIDHFIDI